MTQAEGRAALLGELKQLRSRIDEIERELRPDGIDATTELGLGRLGEALRGVSNVGIFRADRDGNCIDVNDHWCEITGLSREDALGKGYLRSLRTDYRERLSRPWPALPPGQVIRGEYCYVDPYGEEIWVESDTFCELDSEGRSSGVLLSTVVEVTTQKRAVEAERRARMRLEEHVRELETLYETTPVGLCFVDSELRFRRINRLLAEINGVPLEEHVGRKVEDVIPAVADQVVPLYRQVLETGEPVRGREITGSLPSDPGVEHTWVVNYYPIGPENGGPEGVITVVQDITARKRAEQTIRDARNHLARAQQVAGIGSWEWRLADDAVVWSDELYRILGRPPGTPPSFDLFVAQVHPADRPAVRSQLDRVFETGRAAAARFRIVLGDGSLRWVRGTAMLERNPDGLPSKVVGTAQRIEAPDSGKGAELRTGD